MWALVTLLLASAQATPVLKPNLAGWYLIYSDRSGMTAISSDIRKEGISGAFTTMLFVNPEPAPGKPNVTDEKVEFDCISNRVRFDGGVVSTFGSPPREDDVGSVWETPPKQSNLEDAINYGCHGQPSSTWLDTHLDIDHLIEFYYEKVLGIPEPK